ncbi:MAG: hypothetical protein AVDCRST_MAG86-1697, partial [uncultured Truepera sp.]
DLTHLRKLKSPEHHLPSICMATFGLWASILKEVKRGSGGAL